MPHRLMQNQEDSWDYPRQRIEMVQDRPRLLTKTDQEGDKILLDQGQTGL
jgi:hypothetical protein